MEEPSKNIEEITREWVKEAGIQQPAAGFVNGVMSFIEAKAAPNKGYQPLISLRGWGVVSMVFLAAIVLLLLFPIGGVNYFENMDIPNFSEVKNPFAGLEVSKTMIYGFGFLALFLIQIPFLKRRFVN